MLILAAALSFFSFDAGRKYGGHDQGTSNQRLSELQAVNAALEEEIGRLRGLLMAREGSLEIEQASQRQLAEKNKMLLQENAKLKEELAVYERLARPELSSDGNILLDRLSVKSEGGGQYRYSFLVALQGARRGKETKLNLQLQVSRRGGGDKMLFPAHDDPEPGQYEIALRNFRRIDGRIAVPSDFQIGEVEVRILEAGIVRAAKKVTL